MMQLAGCGNVILIGRAGNIITGRLPNVLHVRLVAPLEDRIERICRAGNKTPAEAGKFCVAEDAARARYVKSYFKADIDDPLLYHLVINTSRMGCEAAGRMIGDEVLRLED
jgi:cytidylate kinase